MWKFLPDVVLVPSATQDDITYSVNTALWVCTCPAGSNGAPCKHQWAAVAKYQDDCFNFLPVNSPSMIKLFYYIATGKDDVPDSWFVVLKDGVSSTVTCPHARQQRARHNTDVIEPDNTADEVIKTVADIACIT